MLVPQLLLETLEDLESESFKMFKWYLGMNIVEGCEPIRKAHLDDASRIVAVNKIIDSYGEESAVNVTVEILKKIYNSNAAEKLRKKYAEGKTAAAPAARAAPATMTAQQGSVIIAPTVTGGTSGQWNITINK